MNTKLILVSVLLVSLVLAPVLGQDLFAKQSKSDKKAEKTIKKALDRFTGKNQKYGEICSLLATTKTNPAEQVVYEKDCVPPPPPPPPVCKPGTHLENGVCVPDPTPTCPPEQHMENGVCVNNPPPPSCPNDQHLENGVCVPNTPTPTSGCGVVPANHVRIGVTADTSVGGPEFKLMKECHTDINVVAGDLWYDDDADDWFNNVEGLGWTKGNTVLAVGNHDDSGGDIRQWMSKDANYYQWNTADGKIDMVVIDGKESGFTCGTSQFTAVKNWLESSDAWYKFVVIHEPFASVKSNHGPNGGFDCWHKLFVAENVDAVLQGHNHNYQFISISGIAYTVGAPGTHDTGSGLYGCDSTTFNGQAMKCIRKNGALFMDVDVNSPSVHKIVGKAVDLNNKVFDSWVN